MCGIAGIFHRGGGGKVGREMTSMLLAMRHRGADSSGYAVYGTSAPGELIVRFRVAEQEEMSKGHEIESRVKARRAEVDARLLAVGAEIVSTASPTDYAFRYVIQYGG